MKNILAILILTIMTFGVQAHHRHHGGHGHNKHGHNRGYYPYRAPRHDSFLGIQLGDLRIGIGGSRTPNHQFKYSHDTRRHYHGNVVCYSSHTMQRRFKRRAEFYGEPHDWRYNRY